MAAVTKIIILLRNTNHYYKLNIAQNTYKYVYIIRFLGILFGNLQVIGIFQRV